MLRHILSNTAIKLGRYYHRKIPLYKNRFVVQKELDKSQQTIIQSGPIVGMLKRNLFSGAIDTQQIVTFRYPQSVEVTARFTIESKACISEAVFPCLGLFCAVDLLVIEEANCYAYPLDKTTQVKSTILQL